MRIIFSIALLAGCGSAVADMGGALAANAPTAIGCETNLDAGSPCEPCPGNVRSTQTDYSSRGDIVPIGQLDGGVAVSFRECDCAPNGCVSGRDDAGTFHACAIGILWRSCPLLPATATVPAATCAQIRSEFARACKYP